MAYSNAQRNSIEVENATVLQHDAHVGHQYILRFTANRRARPARCIRASAVRPTAANATADVDHAR
jgi:hypothetical protein